MENNEVPFSVMLRSTAVSGLILGLASIVISVLLYVTGAIYAPPVWTSVLSFLVTFVGTWYFTVNYRNTALDGYMPYGKAFTYGWFTYMFAGVLAVLFSVVLQTVIDPQYLDKMAEIQREQLYSKGMSDAQIEQSLEFAKRFASPGVIVVVGLLGNAFVGAIVSLITSAFARKDRPVFE